MLKAARTSGLVAISLLAMQAWGRAGSLELAVFVGPSFPRYQQSFRYDPGPIAPPLPGVTLEQAGAFQLDAKGAVALGAAVTWFVAGPLGIEARLDTADLNVDALGARYDVRVDLPAPLPDLRSELDLGSGLVEVDRLRPVSLNLRLATPGPIRLTASAGVSYLPALNASAAQTVGLGATGLDGRRTQVNVATLALRAEALPDEKDEGRLGLNAGAGLRLSFLPHLALLVEGRAFVFRKQTLRWSRGPSALSALEEALWREVEQRLDPVEFNPTFWQATAGVALSF